MGLTFENAILDNGGFRLSANWSLDTGTRAGLIGPSGAGKSTLLLALAGFVPLHEGSISWNGQDLTNEDPGTRPLTMLFQDHNLFPHMDAASNVGLGIHPGLRLSPAQNTRVREALNQVGLAGLENRKPHSLSGGQRGRVALARALVRNRPLLLLDEPFAALGPALKAELLDLVEQVCRERNLTLLMVSHDPADIARICGSAIVVADGVANPPRETGELLSNPPPALRSYLGK